MIRHARRRTFRPVVEVLESRTLLSVCTVDRLTDTGQGAGLAGDLRYCLTQAQNGDSIAFEVAGTVNLARALPNLTRSVSIEGPGADLLTVRRDTGGNYRIFTVAAGVTASISGLTISNGNPDDERGGGGILNAGALTVSASTLSGNTLGPRMLGGGIENRGTMTISRTVISGNSAGVSGGGGGVFNNVGTLTVSDSTISGNTGLVGGGGIYNDGSLTISGSTLSGNTATTALGSGGGIQNMANRSLTLVNSTLSGNTASHTGGAIVNLGTARISSSTIAGNSATTRTGGVGGGTTVVRNTIIAGNTALIGPDVDDGFRSDGYNLIGNARDGSAFRPTDLLDVNPRLGPLEDNGGPTLTHALLDRSPAVNAGDPEFEPPPDTDQRGLPRVVGTIDIGAFEEQPGPIPSFYIFPEYDSVAAGVPFDLYVYALDADGKVMTDYTGEVQFWTSDILGRHPYQYTFREEDQGVAYFPFGVTLFTPGLHVLYVFDTVSFSLWGYAAFEVVSTGPGYGPGSGPDTYGLLVSRRESVPDAVGAARLADTLTQPRTPSEESRSVSTGQEVLLPVTNRKHSGTGSRAFDVGVLGRIFGGLE